MTAGAGYPSTQISATSECIRVVICDDHALFRRGLMIVLEELDDVEVVAEAANGREAVELVTHLAPHVVVMDLQMPELDGIAATQAILEVLPTVNVIVLTVSDDEHDLLEAMRVGAAGYLLKEVTIDEIGAAVRAVHRGQRLVTPSLATRLVAAFDGRAAEPRRRATDAPIDSPHLTAREIQVLQCVADGATNRVAADRLGIAENTVKNHVRNVLEKLRLHSRIDAVRHAVEVGLIDQSSATTDPRPPRLGDARR